MRLRLTWILFATLLILSSSGCSDRPVRGIDTNANLNPSRLDEVQGIQLQVQQTTSKPVVSGEKCCVCVTLTNRRSKSVQIRSVAQSCGCTQVLIEGKSIVFPCDLSSNQSIEIDVVIDTTARVGENLFQVTFEFNDGSESWFVDTPVQLAIAHGIYCDPPLFEIELDTALAGGEIGSADEIEFETTVFRDVESIRYSDLKIGGSNPAILKWEAIDLEEKKPQNGDKASAIARLKLRLSTAKLSADPYIVQHVWLELKECARRCEIPVTIRRTTGGVRFSPNILYLTPDKLERRVIFRSRDKNPLEGLTFTQAEGVTGIVDIKNSNLAFATLKFDMDVLQENSQPQPVRFILEDALVAEIQVVTDRSASKTVN